MGKTNKANRTKGNTRPSSSEHSAQLLTLSGKSLSGFIGFDSLEKDIPSYIPVTGQHSSDAAELSVDSDLRMVMRKMLKRDSVTRLKAVQEFGDLCSEKDKDIVKNVLPFWPRLFNKLALDHDRRIREATHQANGKLISNVKREIAPYLKNIMGVWLLGQNDLHAPAATVAQTTFIDTFPKNKQSEALMHCRNEIFSLFKDNLFEQTAKTMSDPISTTAEDIERKYTVVISATLQAMKLFLVTVSSNEVANVQDDYLSIVSENKFWKFAKSKEPQIRGSWYVLISHLCHVKPDIFAEMEKKLVSTIFGCLSENDPIVAPAVWESALHVVVNFENCWQGLSIQKVVLPQLWALLNDAGKGNAHVVYPNILPFLSKFPKEVISKDTFLLQFFTSLKQSLLLDCVKLSSMECDAILTTFMECLEYISFCILSTKDGSALLEKVLSDHVLSLVEISFYETKYRHLATSKLYSLLGSLIRKIENKCLNDSDELGKAFSQTLTLFWNNTYNIFCKIFEKKEEEKIKISVFVTYFFHSIFNSPLPVKSEKGKVRFEDETEPEDAPQVSSDGLLTIDLHKQMPITFMHIIKFIKKLCNKTDENINLCYLKILDEILASTLNAEYLKDILKSYDKSCDTPEKASLTFFNEIILKWVSVGKLDQSNVTCISDIVFSLCSSVSEDEALDMLYICCEAKNPIFLESILGKALSVYANEPLMERWLKSSTFIECILNGLKEMVESLTEHQMLKDEAVISAHKNILLMCLVNKDIQDVLEESKNIEKILIVCKEFMENALNCENVDYIFKISCSIIKTILLNNKNCWSYSTTDDLLSVLFNWNLHAEKFGFSEIICSAISDVWSTAILSSCKNTTVTRKGSFLLSAAEALNSTICSLSTSKQASRTFNEILNLLHMVDDAQSGLASNYSSAFILSELLGIILPSDTDWQKLRKGLVFSSIPSTLERKFTYHSHTENATVSQDCIFKLFIATKLVSQIFAEEIDKYNSCKEEQYFEQYILKHVPDLLWCLSYCSGNGYMSKDGETQLEVKMLDEYCMKILSFISFEKSKDILKDMFYCSLSKGLYGAIPFQLLIEKMKILYKESTAVFDELLSEATMMESDYVSLNVQILSHHVSKEKKIFFLKNILGDLTDNSNNHYKEINDEYLRKLGEVCCFIQDVEAIDDEVKNLLSLFFTMFSSFSDCPKDLNLFYLEFVSLMSSVVQHAPSLVTRNAWCFMQSFLSSYIKIGKSKKFDKPEDLLFLFQVSLAYSTSYSFIFANEDAELSWVPSISNELNEGFISLFIYAADVIKKFHPLPQAFEIALDNLLKATEYIPEKVLFNYVTQCCEATCVPESKDDKVSTPLDNLLSILVSDIHHLQLSAHIMLIKIMPLLSESLSNANKCECDDTEDEEEKVPAKILSLVEGLNLLNELIENMLWDVKIGECCLVLPNTEPYGFVSAYLFTWLQMLEFISTSPSQVRPGYVSHLEETKLLSTLFSNVFRLMPENPLSCLKKASGFDTPKKENLMSLFLSAPKISPGDPSSEEIQIIACYVFCTAMRKVPASVRTWWNNLDNKSSDIVNKFTSKYISGILCAEEIQGVHSNENLFKNMVVKARLGSREVIATYTVDDFAIELCVQLPANYPLGPISAERSGKIIIAQKEWRHWLMQLTTVLNYQNGSILDGLNIWKKNLDKKFEGVEECMICYYILHSSTLKLPKLSCHTCRKKFHSACLYKWFHSINNTKCPLCRNEFTISS